MKKLKSIITICLAVSILCSATCLSANEVTLNDNKRIGERITEKLESLGIKIKDLNELLDKEIFIEVDVPDDISEKMEKVENIDVRFIVLDKNVNNTKIIDRYQVKDFRYERPFLGVHTINLTIPKARELGYKKQHGVLITSVVDSSPAQLHRLMENDIIVSIDSTNVLDDIHLSNLINSYYVGDEITIDCFREGKINRITLNLDSRSSGTIARTNETKLSKSEKKNVGWGGGSWYPIWATFDMDDVNYIFKEFGYMEELSNDGLLFHGGGGKLFLGNGFFLGGMGAGYKTYGNYMYATPEKSFQRKIRYNNVFWGITLDKRYALHKNFIFSPGFMIGGGKHKVSIAQIESGFTWNDLGSNFTEYRNYSASLSRKYAIVKPNIELMYRLLPWLALRAETGYIYGYSGKDGWRTNLLNGEYKTTNSPNTAYEGLTFSIGPWFGF